MSGFMVQGTINGVPGVLVNFMSSQMLTEPANGQARIETLSGSALTNITVSLANNLTFGDLIFNPAIIGNLGNGGSGVVNVVTTQGTQSQNFTFANGSNFFTVLAGANEALVSVGVSVPGGFASFQQPRISGPFVAAGPLQEPGVPEPGSVGLATVGLVFIGCSILYRCMRSIAAGQPNHQVRQIIRNC
jgi:hypothetical protein